MIPTILVFLILIVILIPCFSQIISTSNHMFVKAIWDKLPECIFENFEIARVKQGQLQNFQKSRL